MNGIEYEDGEYLRRRIVIPKAVVEANIICDIQNVLRAPSSVVLMALELWRRKRSASKVGVGMVDVAEFLAREVDPDPWLLKGIVPRGGVMAIGGQYHNGKTWWLLYLIRLLVDAGFRVGFCSPEDSAAGMQHRLRMVGLGKAQGKLFLLHGEALTLAGSDETLADSTRDALVQEIKRHHLDVLFLDPNSDLLGDADENAAGETRQFWHRVQSIKNATNASVGVLAHTQKTAGKGRGDKTPHLNWIRGSGTAAGSIDVGYIIRYQKDQSTKDEVTKVEAVVHQVDCVGNRFGDDYPHFKFVITKHEDGSRDFEQLVLSQEDLAFNAKFGRAGLNEAKTDDELVDALVRKVVELGGVDILSSRACDEAGVVKNDRAAIVGLAEARKVIVVRKRGTAKLLSSPKVREGEEE